MPTADRRRQKQKRVLKKATVHRGCSCCDCNISSKAMKLCIGLWIYVFLSESISGLSFLLAPQQKSGFTRLSGSSGRNGRHRVGLSKLSNKSNVCEGVDSQDSKSISRRNILGLSSGFLFASMGTGGVIGRTEVEVASAAEEVQEVGMVDAATVANRLHSIPTFVIVDKAGVPYAVVGEDAKVTGYFFTTYGEASRILKVALESAEKGRREALEYLRLRRRQSKQPPLSTKEELEEVGPNPWVGARISTVPLDFAVSLAIKSQTPGSSRGRTYFQVAPAETDIEDALALDKSGKKELAEGKVPLFYFEDFERESNGQKESPLYFRKSELIESWKKLHPKDPEPEVLVSELFSVITEMVKPGGTDEDLKQIVFTTPSESEQKAKECLKSGGKEAAFKLGQTIIVL